MYNRYNATAQAHRAPEGRLSFNQGGIKRWNMRSVETIVQIVSEHRNTNLISSCRGRSAVQETRNEKCNDMLLRLKCFIYWGELSKIDTSKASMCHFPLWTGWCGYWKLSERGVRKFYAGGGVESASST